MANIAIIGSGNVGANTAFFIAERNLADVVMYDIQEGLAAGKALDLMEAAPIRGYQYGIRAVKSMDEVLSAEMVVVTAGIVREPGMKREALLVRNREIIDSVASHFTEYGGVVAIATEPVDLMTMRFVATSGMESTRVVGLGGVLDATRLRHVLSEKTGISSENISAMVVGRHSDQMIPLMDYCRVNGVPVEVLIGADGFAEAAETTRTAGDVIVEMAQRASAYYAPSAAAADVCEAVIRDTKRILPVSFVWGDDEPYGVSGLAGIAMSLPVVLGSSGVERVMKPRLTEKQWAKLRRSAAELESLVAGTTATKGATIRDGAPPAGGAS